MVIKLDKYKDIMDKINTLKEYYGTSDTFISKNTGFEVEEINDIVSGEKNQLTDEEYDRLNRWIITILPPQGGFPIPERTYNGKYYKRMSRPDKYKLTQTRILELKDVCGLTNKKIIKNTGIDRHRLARFLSRDHAKGFTTKVYKKLHDYLDTIDIVEYKKNKGEL